MSHIDETAEKLPLLSDTLYTRLKWTVTIVLPAVATFYFTIANIFGLPYGTEVVAALAALATLGGTLLGLSAKSYNNSDAQYDGYVTVTRNEDGAEVQRLNIDATADDLVNKKGVKVKVVEI